METIKEASIEYADSIYKNLVPDTEITNTHDDLWNYTTIDFVAGVEFAQRWIPVEEELPEVNQNILIKRAEPFDKYEITGFRRANKYYSNETGNEIKNVICWRPIELK